MSRPRAWRERAMEKRTADGWNRCDACGRFIGFNEFGHGATRLLVTPDSHFTREEYATLCREHSDAR